jgi:hypothetical protein
MDHPDRRVDARVLERDLRRIFGTRLQSLSTYGDGTHALVVVDTLTVDDLHACAERTAAWHAAQLATPLLLAAHEFESALDAFPLEFGAIIAHHTVVFGKAPFDGLAVDPADLRRAIEVQARSQLIHLREGFLETRGDANALALLIADSAPAFGALVESVRRLNPSFDPVASAKEILALAGAHDVAASEAERIFPAYVEAVERLVKYVDTWTQQ